MKNAFLFMVPLLTAFSAYGFSKNCETSPSFSIQYSDGPHPSHEGTTKSGSLKVGGAQEQIPKNVDRLAIQRALVSCTPGALRCFKERSKKSVELMVSFVLTPNGEQSSAKDWSFSSKDQLRPEFARCLSQVFSEGKFGLMISEPIQVKTSLHMK